MDAGTTQNNKGEPNESWRDVRGLVHSVETCGTVDGPGIRFVAFLSGCSLRCKYCHNPDTSFMRRGEEQSAGELVDEIAKYTNFLKGAGGVTLSGGDPLFQIAFTRSILHGCKNLGLHTTLDTSGALGDRVDDEMLDDIDLVLLDIKAGIPAIYRDLTAGELEPTLRFARRLLSRGKKAWLRYVLVPGVTDSDESVRAVAKFAREVPIFERVDVLPFHRLGFYKWTELGLKNPLEDVPEPSSESVSRAQKIFSEWE